MGGGSKTSGDTVYNKKYKEEYQFWMQEYKKIIEAKKQKELEQQEAEQAKQKASSDAHRSAITMLKAQFGDDYVDNILEDDANDHDQETEHDHDPDITSTPTDNSISLNVPPTVSPVVSTLLTTTQNIMASNVASKFDKADDFAILWDKNIFTTFMRLAGLDSNTVDLNLLKSPWVVAAFVHFTDLNVPTGVDSKSNTCDEGQEDVPEKSSDASSRCDVSKTFKQEDSSEKWGKKCLSNEELDKLLLKWLKRTPEKGGSVIPSPLSPHDKSVTRTDSQNLKEMAPAKKLEIQGATLMLKWAKRTGKNFEASLTKMGCELVVYDSDDVSFFTAICTMFLSSVMLTALTWHWT